MCRLVTGIIVSAFLMKHDPLQWNWFEIDRWEKWCSFRNRYILYDDVWHANYSFKFILCSDISYAYVKWFILWYNEKQMLIMILTFIEVIISINRPKIQDEHTIPVSDKLSSSFSTMHWIIYIIYGNVNERNNIE